MSGGVLNKSMTWSNNYKIIEPKPTVTNGYKSPRKLRPTPKVLEMEEKN